MRRFLLLVFAGLTYGLQPKVEYVYDYFGQVDTGLPDISTETLSSVAIQAQIHVVVHEDGHAFFKIENPKFGEYHGDLGCNVRADVPYEFVEPKDPEFVKYLGDIYEANLFGNEDFALHLAHDEPLWLTNMRKAVTSLFRNKVLGVNFDHSEDNCPILKLISKDEIPETFVAQEDTIFGRCNIDYTVHPIPDFMATPHLKHLSRVEEDQQNLGGTSGKANTTKKGRKGSKHAETKLPALDNNLYHVVKSVDFDHCEFNVGFQGTTGGIDETIADGQRGFFSGRHSVSEYLIRGSGKGFRVEMAAVEGGYTTLPFPLVNQLTQERTNQTLHLVSVTSVKTDISSFQSAKTISTWMHQFMTSAPTPKVSPVKPFMIYTGNPDIHDYVEMLTGIPDTDESIASKKHFIRTTLEDVSTDLTSRTDKPDIPHGANIEKLQIVGHVLGSLSKKDIQELADEVVAYQIVERAHETLKKKLFMDAIASAGTNDALEVLIKLYEDGSITPLQTITLSMTVTMNYRDPRFYPNLIDWTTKVDITKEPFIASLFMVNLAHTLHFYCIDPHAPVVHYAGDFYGDFTCDKQYIKNHFVKYLRDVSHNEDLTWERLVAIKALAILKISTSVEILTPIALGHKGQSPILRAMAIHAMERWKLPMEIKNHVVDLLTRIYSDVGELPRVRVVALITVASYGPKTSFWYKIARLSWREPSALVASAYTSIIQTYSEGDSPLFADQQKAAMHALLWAKPTSRSARYPFVAREITNVGSQHLSKIVEYMFGAYEFPAKNTDFTFYYYVLHKMKGLSITNMELVLFGSHLGQYAKSEKADYESTSAEHKTAEKLFDQVQKVIEAIPKDHPDNRIIMMYLRILESLQAVVPFTKSTLDTLPFSDTLYMGSVLLELQTGMTIVLGKFFNPMTQVTVVPNELGLPVMEHHTMGMVLANKAYAQATVGSVSLLETNSKVHVELENFFRFESISAGSLHIMIPWSNTMLSTTVKSTRNVKLPFLYTFHGEVEKDSYVPDIELVVKPIFDSQFSLVGGSNTPISTIGPMSFNGKMRTPEYKAILKHKPIHSVHHLPKKYAGLDLEFEWDSQFRHPFNLYDVQRFMSESKLTAFAATPKLYYLLASKTPEQWSFDLKLDLSKSETKSISSDFSCDISADKKPQSEEEESEQDGYSFGQFTEFFYDQSQENQEEKVEGFHHGNSEQKTINMKVKLGDSASTCNMNIHMHGKEERKYNIFYSWSKPSYADHRKRSKSHLSFDRSALPGFDSNPLSICLDTKKATPVFTELDTLDSILHRNSSLDTKIVREITINCTGKPMLRLASKLSFSKEGLKHLKSDTEGSCTYDKYDPMSTFLSSALYDDVESHLKWKSVCNKASLPILSKAIALLENTLTLGFKLLECEDYQNPNELHFAAHRDSETNLWNYDFKRGDDERNFHYFETGPLAQTLFSVGSHANMIAHLKHNYIDGKISKQCSVSLSDARSFDGNVFSYEASQCWTVIASDCVHQQWAVLIRQPKSESSVPEVRVIDRKNGIVANIGKVVEINGKEVDPANFRKKIYSEDGHLTATVFKQVGHYMVKIPKVVLVAVKERVEVKTFCRPEVCGLCGDQNSEPLEDFIGPHRCVFTDSKVFAASWTGGGETCDSDKQADIRDKVEKAQATCHKVKDYFAHLKEEHRPVHFFYRFIIHHEGDLICASSWTHPVCDEGFASDFEQDDVNAEFKCWHKDRAPAKLIEADTTGKHYMADPMSESPMKFIHHHITVPRNCASHD